MIMSSPQTVQIVAAVIFAVAIIHTFSTKFFEHLAHTNPAHAGIWHLLGEVEVVFGFWAMVLMLSMLATAGQEAALHYLESRNFTEPMFVFAIMVVAGTRPVLQLARNVVEGMAGLMPLNRGMATYLLILGVVPLLGSFITEPAAMTVGALMLRDVVFARNTSNLLKYGTLGVLFVNVSIGGVLTAYAAPPVLMAAAKWNFDTMFMLTTFGWKAALAVFVNAAGAMLLFRDQLSAPMERAERPTTNVPLTTIAVHVLFLLAIVLTAHHPVVFLGILLFFMGFVTAYARHQDRLILREGLLVAFFLAGLVVLGGQQQWWLQPLLTRLDENAIYFGATALTAVTDNAALTYLGSLVEGLTPEFKQALLAGAVTGGGLTIIANAPNPAGAAILKEKFSEGAISPLGLLAGAVPPTLVTMAAFRLL
jgi:hypothetical protein